MIHWAKHSERVRINVRLDQQDLGSAPSKFFSHSLSVVYFQRCCALRSVSQRMLSLKAAEFFCLH